MLEEINAYIQSVLPAKLPASKRQSLHDELFSHISDRYEFYREIGFDDEQSTKKAIHDMGEDEKTTEYIRNEFDELYFEKTWWAVLAFFGVLVLNAAAGLLGISVVSPTTTATPSAWKVGVSFLFLLCNIIVIRTIYRFGCRKSLLAFSAGYLLIQLFLADTVCKPHVIVFLCNSIAFLTDLHRWCFDFSQRIFSLKIFPK